MIYFGPDLGPACAGTLTVFGKRLGNFRRLWEFRECAFHSVLLDVVLLRRFLVVAAETIFAAAVVGTVAHRTPLDQCELLKKEHNCRNTYLQPKFS